MFHESMTQDPDPVAKIEWTPPLYPDTVSMQTGHDLMGELVQLQAELQTALRDKADVEIERDVTVMLLRKSRESRRRLVCYIRGEGGGHDTDTETITA